MTSEVFAKFRLVGGTSLSLQLGHRMSDDIDLFTDATYDTIDFNDIDQFLKNNFRYISETSPGLPVGMGKSYFIGDNKENAFKFDVYYNEPFIQNPVESGPYRLATVEEIIAMKIDVIQRGGRKKDFWDLHELLDDYTLDKMVSLHNLRYPYSHDEVVIRSNFANFNKADKDLAPHCLKGKHWELIKRDFIRLL